ncbi:MAG: hypothetical protein KIS76_09705 [Pyrinomonadaceae bacterium]|nr:hypothetical protein [Pyrinomonadaceae bacterium]
MSRIAPAFSSFTEVDFIDETLSTIELVFDGASGSLIFDDNQITTFYNLNDEVFSHLTDKLISVFAFVLAPQKYFFHAGAVSICGTGVIIVGPSFSGKTSLVKSLLKSGAVYYSDDVAVVDRNGFLHPFNNSLSIRDNSSKRSIVSPSVFGAQHGKVSVPLGLILHAPYSPGSTWTPSNQSQAQAVWMLTTNFIYHAFLAIDPAETWKSVSDIIKSVPYYSGIRGEASELVEWLLTRLDQNDHGEF